MLELELSAESLRGAEQTFAELVGRVADAMAAGLLADGDQVDVAQQIWNATARGGRPGARRCDLLRPPRTHVRVDARRDAGGAGPALGSAVAGRIAAVRAPRTRAVSSVRVESLRDGPRRVQRLHAPAPRGVPRRPRCREPHASRRRPTALRPARPLARRPGRCASAARTPRARGTASRGSRKPTAELPHLVIRQPVDPGNGRRDQCRIDVPRQRPAQGVAWALGRHGRSSADSQVVSAAVKAAGSSSCGKWPTSRSMRSYGART